jgi:hypothetical protein
MEVPEVKDVSYLTGNILSLKEMLCMSVCMFASELSPQEK